MDEAMLLGFLDPHLASRKPLRSDGLDKSVICGKGGFGFGTEEEIEKKLLDVQESDVYRRCVIQDWEHKQALDNPRDGVVDDKYWSSLSSASLACEFTGIDWIAPASKKSNWSSGFSLCGQTCLSLAFSPSPSPMLRSPLKSQLPPPLEMSAKQGIQHTDSTPSFRSTFWPRRR